jgi:fatty-acyl-CoA synthase
MYYNDWLYKRNELTPDRVAVVDDAHEREYSYAEMNRRAHRLAAYMQREWDIAQGDRVACLSTNRMEYLDLYFACGKLGAVLVPLNFRLRAYGIQELLEDCAPKGFWVERAFADLVDKLSGQDCYTHLGWMDGSDPADISQIVQQDQGEAETVLLSEDELAMILYTSGTTGKSKGAMISWRQIHWNSINTAIGLDLGQDDVTIMNTPLYHTGAWHVLFTPLMHRGGKVVLQTEFDPETSNRAIDAHGVTILFGIPTMLRMMMEAENFEEISFASTRFAICGGESCPIPVIERYKGKNVPIRQGYGLTEAGPNCFSLPAEDAIRKKGSVGFPNFHIQTRIVRPDGSETEIDEVGELTMRGPHVFSGYWNNEQATRKTLQEGWVHTGDLFKRDAEGYHFIVGRKKDMYISGGENVYPAQVEKVLYDHPHITQAAVIGIPDEQWGETGCAFVVIDSDELIAEATIIAYCKERLATYQTPSRVIFLDALPTGDSGKIQKKALYDHIKDDIAEQS